MLFAVGWSGKSYFISGFRVDNRNVYRKRKKFLNITRGVTLGMNHSAIFCLDNYLSAFPRIDPSNNDLG